jgi:hypothetical protein
MRIFISHVTLPGSGCKLAGKYINTIVISINYAFINKTWHICCCLAIGNRESAAASCRNGVNGMNGVIVEEGERS